MNGYSGAFYHESDGNVVLDELSKDYYEFDGWRVAGDSSVEGLPKTVTISERQSFDDIDEINYEAVFHPTPYTILINLRGGYSRHVLPISYTYESSDIVIDAPERKGYEFLGWDKN